MKQKLEARLLHWVPPGLNARRELGWLRGGLVGALVWSLPFVISLLGSLPGLYHLVGGRRVPDPSAAAPDFAELMEGRLLVFGIVALAFLAVSLYHYAYHWQGSRSIYTMRRLPDRWELHRRCLTLPVLGALACVLAAFLVLALYFGIYMATVPDVCRAPGQWQRLWR